MEVPTGMKNILKYAKAIVTDPMVRALVITLVKKKLTKKRDG